MEKPVFVKSPSIAKMIEDLGGRTSNLVRSNFNVEVTDILSCGIQVSHGEWCNKVMLAIKPITLLDLIDEVKKTKAWKIDYEAGDETILLTEISGPNLTVELSTNNGILYDAVVVTLAF